MLPLGKHRSSQLRFADVAARLAINLTPGGSLAGARSQAGAWERGNEGKRTDGGIELRCRQERGLSNYLECRTYDDLRTDHVSCLTVAFETMKGGRLSN